VGRTGRPVGTYGPQKNPRAKVGDRRLQDGYVYVKVERGHWAAHASRSWAAEHRIVMGEMLGRPLHANESPHHKNGIRTDNRPENLELWVRQQPRGARVSDLQEFARWVRDTYGLDTIFT